MPVAVRHVCLWGKTGSERLWVKSTRMTAGLGQLPPPLTEQLKVGGRLVMPVGPAYTTQHLTVVEKIAPGKTTTRAVARVLCALYAFTKLKSR
jgi:protein-L-isoaspartate O-methyltransferase